MSTNTNDSVRLPRFEKTIATCLSLIPLLFAGQCLTAIGASRLSESMILELGAKLPKATQIAISWRSVWLVIAIGLPIAAIVVSRIKTAVMSVVFSTLCGVMLFMLSQFLSYATWLPFVELGRACRGDLNAKPKLQTPNKRLQTIRFKLPMNTIAQAPHV